MGQPTAHPSPAISAFHFTLVVRIIPQSVRPRKVSAKHASSLIWRRAQVRAGIASAWAALQASIPSITAAQAQVKAARLATQGVIEEQKVGQRTLLDVLDQQEDLISARIALVQAQHDRIVASFAVASATGNLSASNLKLKVQRYDPNEHYNAVRDKWVGLRTPDGR